MASARQRVHRAEAAEEEETQGQQAGRQTADLPAAHTSGREDAGGLVGVGEVGGQAGPVVEHEDVRHQADVGDDEDRQRPQFSAAGWRIAKAAPSSGEPWRTRISCRRRQDR